MALESIAGQFNAYISSVLETLIPLLKINMNDYNLEKILLTNKSEEMNENSNESMKLYQKDIISRISQLILDERNEQIQVQEESTWNIYFINKGIYIQSHRKWMIRYEYSMD